MLSIKDKVKHIKYNRLKHIVYVDVCSVNYMNWITDYLVDNKDNKYIINTIYFIPKHSNHNHKSDTNIILTDDLIDYQMIYNEIDKINTNHKIDYIHSDYFNGGQLHFMLNMNGYIIKNKIETL